MSRRAERAPVQERKNGLGNDDLLRDYVRMHLKLEESTVHPSFNYDDPAYQRMTQELYALEREMDKKGVAFRHLKYGGGAIVEELNHG